MADIEAGDGLLPKGTSSPSGCEPPEWTPETRKKGSPPIGTVLYSTLRALDVPFQYWLLRSGAAAKLLQSIGARVVTPPLSTSTSTLLGLSPYHSLIVGLAATSSIKQICWKVSLGDEVVQPSFAVSIGALNAFYNSLNTFMAVWAMTSRQPGDQTSFRSFLASAPPSVYIGVIYYVLGLSMEWHSEVQRKAFNDNVENEGMPYSGGLFNLARNINYGGYAIWRAAYGLACGGWLYAGAMFTSLSVYFCRTIVPNMDAYCQKRYGDRWDDVKRDVPFRYLPLIW